MTKSPFSSSASALSLPLLSATCLISLHSSSWSSLRSPLGRWALSSASWCSRLGCAWCTTVECAAAARPSLRVVVVGILVNIRSKRHCHQSSLVHLCSQVVFVRRDVGLAHRVDCQHPAVRIDQAFAANVLACSPATQHWFVRRLITGLKTSQDTLEHFPHTRSLKTEDRVCKVCRSSR